MAMPSTDFLTKQQMRDSIALPKVGVKYSDGNGKSKMFSVGNASELGSLDSAFSAAAAGVMPMNQDLRPSPGSAVVIENKEISLVGERGGKSRQSKKFFGTDKIGTKGWHSIKDIDKEEEGDLVGATQNTEAKADEARREIGRGKGCWSYEVSRSAIKKDEDTGVVQLFNYYKTIYMSEMGRVLGQSSEKEVLVGTIEGGTATMDEYLFCAKPVFDESDTQKTGPIKYIQFATAKQFRTISLGQKEVRRLEQIVERLIATSAPYEEKAKALAELNEADATLRNAESVVKTLTVGEFGVKAVFSDDNILQKMLFGTAYDLKKNADNADSVKTVETVEGCPYQS